MSEVDPGPGPAQGVRRNRLEQGGAALARELDIDLDAFGVGSNLHWASALMRLHFERAPLAEVGLTLTDFVALWSLLVGGEMETGEVADEVGLPASSFSAVARRLEQRGLLSRRRNEKDGRSILVSATPEGAAVARHAFRLVNAQAARMTRRLSSEQKRVMAELLRTVADELCGMMDEA